MRFQVRQAQILVYQRIGRVQSVDISLFFSFMSKQEDNIKSYLHMLGMQQQFYQTSYSPRYLSPSWRSNSFQPTELSDWRNQKQFSMEMTSSLPKLRKANKIIPSRSQSVQMGNYPSQLLRDLQSRKKQQSKFINPVVIKFNTQVCGNAMRRSQLLFHRILHNDSEKKVEDPKKLRQLLRRIKPKQEQHFGALSPPKTERCSGILRMLKRREQVRIYKRQKQNPQALTAIKLQSK